MLSHRLLFGNLLHYFSTTLFYFHLRFNIFSLFVVVVVVTKVSWVLERSLFMVDSFACKIRGKARRGTPFKNLKSEKRLIWRAKFGALAGVSVCRWIDCACILCAAKLIFINLKGKLCRVLNSSASPPIEQTWIFLKVWQLLLLYWI